VGRALKARVDLGEQWHPVVHQEVHAERAAVTVAAQPVSDGDRGHFDLIEDVAAEVLDPPVVVAAIAERTRHAVGYPDQLDRGVVHRYPVVPCGGAHVDRHAAGQVRRHADERLGHSRPLKPGLPGVVHPDDALAARGPAAAQHQRSAPQHVVGPQLLLVGHVGPRDGADAEVGQRRLDPRLVLERGLVPAEQAEVQAAVPPGEVNRGQEAGRAVGQQRAGHRQRLQHDPAERGRLRRAEVIIDVPRLQVHPDAGQVLVGVAIDRQPPGVGVDDRVRALELREIGQRLGVVASYPGPHQTPVAKFGRHVPQQRDPIHVPTCSMCPSVLSKISAGTWAGESGRTTTTSSAAMPGRATSEPAGPVSATMGRPSSSRPASA
jgi:hypothetical protein